MRNFPPSSAMQGKGIMETFIFEPDVESEEFSRELALMSLCLDRMPSSVTPKFTDLLER